MAKAAVVAMTVLNAAPQGCGMMLPTVGKADGMVSGSVFCGRPTPRGALLPETATSTTLALNATLGKLLTLDDEVEQHIKFREKHPAPVLQIPDKSRK